MVVAGRLPASALRTVAPGTQLANSAANAFLNLVLIAKMLDGTRVKPAGSVGAGYRDLGMAMRFYRAGQGDKLLRQQLGIDPNLKVSIGYPGSHVRGDRIDMLFSTGVTRANLSLAERYGFTREFGERDVNHYQHDGRTAVSGVRSYDKIRLLARYYNSLHLGRQTDAASTGNMHADNFAWLIQQSNRNSGDYPMPYKVDDVFGPKTTAVMNADWRALKAAA